MSRQTDADARLLSVFHLLLVGILILLFVFVLLGSMSEQRGEVQQAALKVRAQQWMERVAWWRQRWLEAGRPTRLQQGGENWLLSPGGWLLGHDVTEPGEAACASLWTALLAEPLQIGRDPVKVEWTPWSQRCHYRLASWQLSYDTQGGAALVLAAGVE
ncbi:hypothetical protein ABHF91_14510 [Pseudaeromonas sp. ZJS20]|uniref:hypothetical protein n=1 Tax=Pseudaeromonas aegiceratis TaxID=3153928 RepID=UPI00390C5886